MSITVYPVTPGFAAEIGDVDLTEAAPGRRFRGDQDGVLEIRGAGISRPGPDAGAAPRVLGAIRPRRERAHARSQGDADALQRRLRGYLQPRRRTAGSGARRAASACTRRATSCGTPTARSSACRASARCCIRGPSRRSAATPSSRTSAPPTTRCPRRRRRSCRDSSSSTGSCTRAGAAASPSSTKTRCSACRPCRRCWCARFPKPAASRCTSRRTPGASSACRTRKAAR